MPVTLFPSFPVHVDINVSVSITYCALYSSFVLVPPSLHVPLYFFCEACPIMGRHVCHHYVCIDYVTMDAPRLSCSTQRSARPMSLSRHWPYMLRTCLQ